MTLQAGTARVFVGAKRPTKTIRRYAELQVEEVDRALARLDKMAPTGV